MPKTKNIFLKIEYVGSKYHGWQKQRNIASKRHRKTATIQQSIESVLEQILQQPVNLIASGRTDAGVHAKAQCANFKADTNMSLAKLKISINALLAEDIRVKAIKYVKSNFHCRYDAQSKIYRYVIFNSAHASAFLRETTFHVFRPLKVNLMQKQAKVLKGKHDFKSFQAADKKDRSSVRTIKNISVKKRGNLILIDIEANGFLYNMARNIAGTLIAIGRDKMEPGAMKMILDKKNRKYASPTAAAKGLCLMRVKY
ncbi:MAG: tRNA pseudouridine(38-40) synthase TruA [Candidatus Omnitrophica bacterium]|nr:tRNA pseudouridine(38-40) synthase TruA [Candidatus Omnitrophota bacterium]